MKEIQQSITDVNCIILFTHVTLTAYYAEYSIQSTYTLLFCNFVYYVLTLISWNINKPPYCYSSTSIILLRYKNISPTALKNSSIFVCNVEKRFLKLFLQASRGYYVQISDKYGDPIPVWRFVKIFLNQTFSWP